MMGPQILPPTKSVANDLEAGITAQLWTGVPGEFIDLVERLGRDAESSKHRLALRLRQALSKHDLTRQELLAAQRDVIRLARIGAEPGPTEYWQRSALPRAAALVDEAMLAVADEGAALGEAIDQFLSAATGPPLTGWANRSLNGALLREATARPINQLIEAAPPPPPIHALGTWRQGRLHRTAIWRSLPELLPELFSTSGDTEALIGRTELALLDGPPWSHGDRLLSAFELAHGEIRTQTELVADGLTTRVATRGRRYLSPSQRVTIELRH